MLTDDQIKLRMTGLGGSDIAAACGLSPHKSPLQLYREKTGEAPPKEETWPMFLGNVLEGPILQMWQREHRAAMWARQETLFHPSEPWVFATPDGLAMFPDGKRVVLEAKRADYKRPDWGRAGTSDIPVTYVAQCLWLMLVLRARGEPIQEAHVAAFFRGSDFQMFVIPWDAARAAWLLETGRKFWFDCVVARKAPEEREAA